MDERDARQVAERLWEALQAGDWETAGDYLHDDFVQEWPQSGERIIGRDNAIAIEQSFPGGLPTMRFRRTLADGNLAVAEFDDAHAEVAAAVGIGDLELRWSHQSQPWDRRGHHAGLDRQ